MKSFARYMLVLFAALSFFSGAQAQEATEDQCALIIGTGPAGKGFSNLFRDINHVCGRTVSICEDRTDGGADNLPKLANNQQSMSFVTLDSLLGLSGTDDNIRSAQLFLPLNMNLIHVLTKTKGYNNPIRIPGETKYGFLKQADTLKDNFISYQTISSLKGMPVALVGSAKVIARMMRLPIVPVDVKDDKEAQALTQEGKVKAYITVSGYPNGAIAALTSSSGFSMVNWDLPMAAPYAMVKKNYTNMGVIGQSFLAVPSVLMVRPFDPAGENGQAAAALRSCIVEHLPSLREGGPKWGKIQPQPGWKEVDLSITYGLTKFSGSTMKAGKK